MNLRFHALLYALSVYLLLAGSAWIFLHHWTRISEEAHCTTVTLVRASETWENAKQTVNSEASKAAEAEEETPKEITPPEQEEPTPEETPEETMPPEEPAEIEPAPPEEPPPPPKEVRKQPTPAPEAPKTPEAVAIDRPAAHSVVTPAKPVERPPMEPVTPCDPELYKSLKRPLNDRELALFDPKEPEKKVRKKSKVHKAQKKHKSRPKHKTRKNRRASKDSVRSRARRGGSLSANRFLASIKRRIARHKRYPPAARRRRLQGMVRVSFTVLPSGRVASISVRGPRAFTASARRAVREAFPVDVSRAGFSLPRRLSVTLRYRLR